MTDLRSDSDAPGPVAHAPLEQCAPYLWGDLDPQDEWEFERHLGTCTICLDECDRLAPLVGAFAGLTPGEIADLRTDPVDVTAPALPTATPAPDAVPTSTAVPALGEAPAPAPAPDLPTPEPTSVSETLPAPGLPPAAASRPGPADRPPSRDAGGRGPAGRASDRSRRGRRRWLVAGTLAMVAAVSLGVTLGQRQQGGAPDARQSTVNPVAAGVTVEGVGAATRLSVTVSARPDGPGSASDVRATVLGLTAGVEYRLYAVAADTRTLQVAQWTATAGPQEVTGEIPAAVDTLAFFAVAETDGTALVSARIGRPAGPR
ncbi:hypothetical protein TPA0907_15940 [Micromonospora humidisoli]|uniref:hypothetical protein n=1 Tax=Micromonospora sp. AKA109 TaxID=2733865 RepID=UPI0022C6183A|nr:hypothetical protein [Micromonospora sp. AKA109]GHJ07227.1 hypothetical protein TPA0907_15940 [Micromonospora sp. AKA109]